MKKFLHSPTRTSLLLVTVNLFLFAPIAPAAPWQDVPAGGDVQTTLTPGSEMTVRLFPDAGSTSNLLLTSEQGTKLRVNLTSTDLKVSFSAASAPQGTGIDGKLIHEGTSAEVKAPQPASDLILRDGQLRLTVEALGANGRPEKVLFPRHPVLVRPDPAFWANRRAGRYRPEDRDTIEQKWTAAPALSQRGVTMRLEHAGKRLRLWIDDRLVNTLPVTGPVAVALPTLKDARAQWRQEPLSITSSGAFDPIRLDGYVMDGGDPKVKVKLLPDAEKEVRQLFPAALEDRALNVGRARWLQDNAFPLISRDSYAPVHFARSAFDRAAPDQLIFAVPNRDYRSVRLLCAPVPGRSPSFSLRLTHFTEHSGDGGGVGDALADYTVVLEKKDGRWPDGCREVGTVRLEDGTQAPLLMVEVPLTTGAIPDLVDAGPERGRRSTQHLDLEITKKLERVMPYNRAIHAMLPVGAPSGVQVLGVTLEGAPRVRLVPRQVGSVYQPGEKTGWDLEIDNAEGGFNGTLEWTQRTIDEAISKPSSRPVVLPAGQESVRIPLDFKVENGWHGFDFKLRDDKGRTVWERSTSLAQLAADTRKAGKESPYGIWWFRQIRNGTEDIDIVGPLLQRLGVRHVSPWRNKLFTPHGEALDAYGVSLSMLGTIKVKDPETYKKSVEGITEQARLHPGIGAALIFHEDTIPKTKFEFPPEFIGREPTPLTEEQKVALQNKLVQAQQIADVHRKLNPNVKLMAGNGSLMFAITLMRNGYPKELADLWGDETTGQAIMPETPPSTTMNTLFWLREYSRKFGYNAPVTTGYEWTYRSTKPGDLTPLEQAQFYLRDILLAHAYNAPHINPGLIYDVGDAYYYSRWGASGIMTRFPLLEPKPSYVAWAVLSQVLDQAKYQRNIPTDSPTTNVIEFQRDGEWIYALWTPRGERDVKLQFETGSTSVSQIDMMGKEAKLPLVKDSTAMKLSGSPLYVRSSKPIVGVTSSETRFPAPAGKWAVVSPLSKAGSWKLGAKMDEAFENEQFDHPRIFSPFQLTSTTDPQKGEVCRLTLEPDPKQPWPLIRYTTLRPTAPIPLEGKPEAIGLWVRGNSSWGRIFFELEDANGRKLASIGRPETGWALNDWKGDHFVNFDGWNFIQVPLPGWYGGTYPMPQNGEWNISEEGPVVHPLKVTGIVVEMREKVVRVNDVVDVTDLSIDLSNLSILKK